MRADRFGFAYIEFPREVCTRVCVYGRISDECARCVAGYVLGLVIESGIVHQTNTQHPDPIHVTVHFLKSAMTGPYEVHLKDLKVGRDFKHLSAAFVQAVREHNAAAPSRHR